MALDGIFLKQVKNDYKPFFTDKKVDFEIDNATIEKYETNGTRL